jgi:hypothetical protein
MCYVSHHFSMVPRVSPFAMHSSQPEMLIDIRRLRYWTLV